MGNAFVPQGMGGVNHIFQFRQRFTRQISQVHDDGWLSPATGVAFRPATSAPTAAKNNARTQLAQTAHPVVN